MSPAVSKITQDTVLPLTLVGALLTGAVWVGSLQWKNDANAEKLETLKDETDRRLMRIEDKVDKIYEMMLESRGK